MQYSKITLCDNMTLKVYQLPCQKSSPAILILCGNSPPYNGEDIALTLAGKGYCIFLLQLSELEQKDVYPCVVGALAHLRQHSSEWGVDLTRIIIWGLEEGVIPTARLLSSDNDFVAALLISNHINRDICTDMTDSVRGIPIFVCTQGNESGANAAELTGVLLRMRYTVELHIQSQSWMNLVYEWLENVLTKQEKTAMPCLKEKPMEYYDSIYEDRAGMFSHTSFGLEQQLVRNVIQGNEQSALASLTEINNQGNKAILAVEPLRSAKNSLICSCTFLARAVIQGGVPADEAFALSDAAIQHIELLWDTQVVLKYEADMLVQYIRLVRKHNRKVYTTPIRRALHYIDSHLDQVLSLDVIAKYANIHPNYLSRRFKQETGTLLKKYVSEQKIREALYFVQYTNYPMAQIASLYGFSSQSYFISSFRSVMGITPGEMRSQSHKLLN